MHQNCLAALRPGPTGEAHIIPPDPLARFSGPRSQITLTHR